MYSTGGFGLPGGEAKSWARTPIDANARRLKNAEVGKLNDRRFGVDQEERTKRLLVDAIQGFG